MNKLKITAIIIVTALSLTGLYFLGSIGYTKLTAESKKNAAIVAQFNNLCPQSSWIAEPYFQLNATTTKILLIACANGEDLILK